MFLFDYQVVLAPGSIFYLEKNIELTFVLELIEYILVGVFYVLVYVVLLVKKDAIVSNYNIMQTDFIQWSIKNGSLDLNEIPKKNLQSIKDLLIPIISITFSISFGPLFSAINEFGKTPLGSRSHFPMIWPMVSQQLVKSYTFMIICC